MKFQCARAARVDVELAAVDQVLGRDPAVVLAHELLDLRRLVVPQLLAHARADVLDERRLDLLGLQRHRFPPAMTLLLGARYGQGWWSGLPLGMPQPLPRCHSVAHEPLELRQVGEATVGLARPERVAVHADLEDAAGARP